MTSIDNYLASLPEYEAMKAPFQEKIDELEAQKDTLEAEIAEIESEIADLQEEMETQVEPQIKQAYLKSLSAPRVPLSMHWRNKRAKAFSPRSR